MDAYKKWSREVDQKTTPRQPGVKSFQAFEIKGKGAGNVEYQVFEVIDVDSYEAWQKILKSEGMKKIEAEWPNYGDENSQVVVYGEKIE